MRFLRNAYGALGARFTRLFNLNYAEFRKKIPIILFVLALMIWSFAWGRGVQRFRWFPYEIIRDAGIAQVVVLNFLTGNPPWYMMDTDRSQSVTVHRPNAFSDGLTLVSGLTKEGNMEMKIITRDGEVVHRWLIDWFDNFWPDPYHLPKERIPRSRPATHIHGIVIFPNGDLVFNLERLGLARVDLCGNVVWQLPYQTHHSVHLDETGNLWVSGEKQINEPSSTLPNHRPPFLEFTVLEVTAEGKIVQEISVPHLLIKNGLQGLLYLSATDNASTEVSDDTLHLNDVETFPATLNPGVFQRGDVLISLRNINAIIVFDPESLKIKYLSIGRVVRQHDPDFIDGNRISVFDNNNVAPDFENPQSRIVILSAENDQVEVVYSGSGETPFYTSIMGRHQWLPNGNVLITESMKARAFEIDPKGELVWEYFNFADKERLVLLDEAQRLPNSFTREFFRERGLTCSKMN